MKACYLAAALPALALAQPAMAEVIRSDDSGFVTRDAAEVTSDPKAVWLALISPAKWWNSAHTWSGEAANLALKPQAGGCFCERIPEVPDPARVTLEGSVEHMRVIQAYPEQALRMNGALGPLQSEAVTGVLTIALTPTEQGTRIVWEYVVGGFMRYEKAVIAKAVDGVMSEQLNGLARLLGRVPGTEPAANAAEEVAEEAAEAPVEVGASPPMEEVSVQDALDAMGEGRRAPDTDESAAQPPG